MDEIILSRIRQEAYEQGYQDGKVDGYNLAGTQMPSAKQERKHGRWEYVDYGGFGNWHCTACRKIAIVNGNENYCPNCGADMREERDDG